MTPRRPIASIADRPSAGRGMARGWAACGFAAALVLAAGCAATASTTGRVTARARFYLEKTDGSGATVVLPRSGVRLAIDPRPVITEGDIQDVDLAQVEVGRCLMFRLTPAAARDLYRMTATHQGGRLVLFINGAALGARRIDRPFADGTILIFAEVTDAELPVLAADLKRSSAVLQREMQK